MRKAIFKKFLQLLFLALVLNSAIFYIVSSSALLNKSRENMLLALETADSLLDYSRDLMPQIERLRNMSDMNDSRFTVIDLDGTVRADSGVEDTHFLENHMEREEVREAIKTGTGHAVRQSETLKREMLYAAILSADGEYVLRICVPYSGMREFLPRLFPAILLSFAIAFIGSSLEAERFSHSITTPLYELSKEMRKMNGDYSDLEFETCPYDEINVIADTTMEMSKNVRESMERLEQEKQIRQEFFSNASHELKTPITSIRGYVELFESGMVLSEETKNDFYKRIKKETLRMSSLVDDILMISRLESRGVRSELVKIDVRELLDEIVTSLAPHAAEREVLIHKNGGNFTIQADLKQLTELFTNLLSNAIKYNNPGGEVWVTAEKEKDTLVFTVKDNGVGIPRESLGRIFERFYRVDKGRSRRQGGTGLGLAIVKHVVNYNKGTLQVESELGKGSTFTVRLPAAGEPRSEM